MSTGTNFVTLDAPAPRVPQRVVESTPTRGQRVVLLRPEGYLRDMRATSDPFVAEDDRLHVRVCSEQQWYAWMLTGATPTVVAYPAYLVFVE